MNLIVFLIEFVHVIGHNKLVTAGHALQKTKTNPASEAATGLSNLIQT